VHVTHDFAEAADLGDRMAVMFKGEIMQVGKPTEIINKPRNEVVASFTGIKNLFKGRVVRKLGGLAEIDVKGVKIYAVTKRVGDVSVAVRPESIIITLRPVKMSARNVLRGIIRDISETPPYVSLSVDAGIPFTVYLTRNAVEDLDLREGKSVYLAFKASDVKVF
ncbi:MAG: TOBE domain-containing protein, partial [Thaumarchaeota archaeon]|nr:TOBE domain-containing protein [Nitrososphaerota archaeon]